MDNLTHTLVGLAAAKAGLERVSPYATAVCVVAANLPDADIVMLAGGQWTYLEHHRGVTHSITGTLVLGLLLPVLFCAVERLIARRRGTQPRARLRGLLIASLLLSASHPLLDWTNSYGVRPFLPWDAHWIYGDLVFIADPWMWLALGGACFLLGAKSRWRVLVWAGLALIVTVALLWLPRRAGYDLPAPLLALWLAGLAGLVYARRAGWARRFGGRIALAALALVPLYWLGLASLHARATVRAQADAHGLAGARNESLLRVAAIPMPANPLHWRCLAETNAANYSFDLFLNRNVAPPELKRWEKPARAESAAIEQAARDRRAQIFLEFARFYDVRVRSAEESGPVVGFTELRFTEPEAERRRGSFILDLRVDGKVSP